MKVSQPLMPKIYSLISKLFFPIILSLSLAHDILALTITLLVCLLWAAAFFLSEPEIKYKYFPPKKKLAILWWAFSLLVYTLGQTHKQKNPTADTRMHLSSPSKHLQYLPPTRTQLKKANTNKHKQAYNFIQQYTWILTPKNKAIHIPTYAYTRSHLPANACSHDIQLHSYFYTQTYQITDSSMNVQYLRTIATNTSKTIYLLAHAHKQAHPSRLIPTEVSNTSLYTLTSILQSRV